MSDNTPSGAGEYTDQETESGRSTHENAEVPGQYDDSELADGRTAARSTETQGEYTDVDEQGDR